MKAIIRTFLTVCFFAFYSCNSESQTDDNRQTSVSTNIQKLALRNEQYHQSSSKSDSGNQDSCSNDELGCLYLTSTDKQGLEAIRSLHKQLDDDANGAVDLSESDDFLREELQYESGAERRQKAFHRNDDMHISVKELWEAWVRSEVHNWTVEQTTEWLASCVGLPQYVPIFILNGVTGATLPRLAVSNMHYLNSVLGIKDPIHKQKIALKAMDVVLFGPPKDSNNHVKDVILMTLLFGALIGCWYAYRMNKNSRRHLKRMMKDMESLHKAELALENLQKELERARLEQECATTEKQDLERRLLEQRGDMMNEMRTSYSDLEVSQLKAEIEILRNELQRAEGELEDRCWSPPVGLQQWLQLTHEIENKAYIKKKIAAEKQLQSAREACEKLKKKRSSLVGAFVSTHGKSIDEVDRSIVEARTSLNEVTQELAERVHRWKQIEILCGFNIINNSGLTVLESILYKGASNGRGLLPRGRISSQDDLDDDSNTFSVASGFESVTGGADSSGSEKQEGEDDDKSMANTVEFILGGDAEENAGKQRKGHHYPHHHDVKSKKQLSQSQDIEHSLEQEVSGAIYAKHLQFDTSPESPVTPILYARQRRPAAFRSEPTITSTVALEEEVYSTDSNSAAVEDISGDKSAKKNKLRFPKLTRKSRITPPPEKHT